MNRILIAAILFCACAYASAEDIHDKQWKAHLQRVKTIGVKKLTALAEKGDAKAQFPLGDMYASGSLGKNDLVLKEAVKWYRKSAEQGFAPAQYKLGVMYRNGLGVPKNKKEGLKRYLKAAELGYARAQFFLGTRYEFGEGVLRDDATAYAWYKIAAANGSEMGKEHKPKLAKDMTPEQIAKAEALVKEMIKKNPKLIQKK